MNESPSGPWIESTIAEHGLSWTPQEVSNLERALVGTSEKYRADVLRSLVNAGYRPSDELFMVVALFGKFAEIGFEIPVQLESARVEFEAIMDRLVESQAESKENFQTFTLSVQRVVESVSERIREQANNLATDYVAAAMAAKEAEVRRMISEMIGQEVRASLRRSLDESKDVLASLPGGGSTVVAAAAGAQREVGVAVPIRFVARGGIALNGKSLLPIAIAAAAALWIGVMFGHAFPRPDVLHDASVGRAIVAQRAAMPPAVRAWVDAHRR